MQAEISLEIPDMPVTCCFQHESHLSAPSRKLKSFYKDDLSQFQGQESLFMRIGVLVTPPHYGNSTSLRLRICATLLDEGFMKPTRFRKVLRL